MVIEAVGATVVDYEGAKKCCGFPILTVNRENSLTQAGNHIHEAQDLGADALVSPCPLCHLNLDAQQPAAKQVTGHDIDLPILHLPQMIGLALGVPPKEMRMDHHVVSTKKLLEKLAGAPVGRKVGGWRLAIGCWSPSSQFHLDERCVRHQSPPIDSWRGTNTKRDSGTRSRYRTAAAYVRIELRRRSRCLVHHVRARRAFRPFGLHRRRHRSSLQGRPSDKRYGASREYAPRATDPGVSALRTPTARSGEPTMQGAMVS